MADLASKLLDLAARRSVETQLGWAHPDCAALQEAARILRGDPPAKTDGPIDGVLSADRPTPTDSEVGGDG